MAFTMLQDFFTAPDYEQYQALEYPENVRFLEGRLREKMENSPYYEVFAPARYLMHIDARNKVNMEVFAPEEFYISNWGGVLNKRNTRVGRIVEPTLTGAGTLVVNYQSAGRKTSMLLNRLIACAFIAPPEGVLPRYADVEVCDNDPDNFLFSNFRWVPSHNHP